VLVLTADGMRNEWNPMPDANRSAFAMLALRNNGKPTW
jgi:hypothetical protein